jgi:hypothetical protein
VDGLVVKQSSPTPLKIKQHSGPHQSVYRRHFGAGILFVYKASLPIKIICRQRIKQLSSKLPPKPEPLPEIYQIRIKGELDSQWSDWFAGLTITLDEDGDTLLTGPVVDQAALHGLLKKIRDLGLPLVSVNHIAPGPASDFKP